jgi:hypothetical protein
MDKTIVKIINDSIFGERSGNDRSGTSIQYGPFHAQQIKFGIVKRHQRETIYCKLPGSKRFYQLLFKRLIGNYEENGKEKFGVSFPTKPKYLFSLSLQEIIELHEELESTLLIEDWRRIAKNESQVVVTPSD